MKRAKIICNLKSLSSHNDYIDLIKRSKLNQFSMKSIKEFIEYSRSEYSNFGLLKYIGNRYFKEYTPLRGERNRTIQYIDDEYNESSESYYSMTNSKEVIEVYTIYGYPIHKIKNKSLNPLSMKNKLCVSKMKWCQK